MTDIPDLYDVRELPGGLALWLVMPACQENSKLWHRLVNATPDEGRINEAVIQQDARQATDHG